MFFWVPYSQEFGKIVLYDMCLIGNPNTFQKSPIHCIISESIGYVSQHIGDDMRIVQLWIKLLGCCRYRNALISGVTSQCDSHMCILEAGKHIIHGGLYIISI